MTARSRSCTSERSTKPRTAASAASSAPVPDTLDAAWERAERALTALAEKLEAGR